MKQIKGYFLSHKKFYHSDMGKHPYCTHIWNHLLAKVEYKEGIIYPFSKIEFAKEINVSRPILDKWLKIFIEKDMIEYENKSLKVIKWKQYQFKM